MNGKKICFALIVTLLSLGIAVATTRVVQENHRLKEELGKVKATTPRDSIEENLDDIYLILAQQSSQMRLIMNISLTKDHWAEHSDRVPQRDCPECIRIYQGIAKQVKEGVIGETFNGYNILELENK